MVGRTKLPAATRSSGSLAGLRTGAPSPPGDEGSAVVFAPKFRSPALRPGLVERPRLTQQLVKSDGALVMVAAPPGFGKSTLLAQWEAADPRRFAFVSLEPSENDPV